MEFPVVKQPLPGYILFDERYQDFAKRWVWSWCLTEATGPRSILHRPSFLGCACKRTVPELTTRVRSFSYSPNYHLDLQPAVLPWTRPQHVDYNRKVLPEVQQGNCRAEIAKAQSDCGSKGPEGGSHSFMVLFLGCL